jgi:hypothetical protein
MADEKRFRLSNLSLDEVSFVDSPANKLAKVILFKRAQPEEETTPLEGVQFRVGFHKDGNDIQSVVFNKAHWTPETAQAWLQNHHLKAERCTDVEKALHYHLQDPKAYKTFRTIVPGPQLSKVLYSMDDSYGKTMSAVDSAVRQKFQRTTYGIEGPLANYLMVRDMIGDSVFFEQNGGCYRVDYSVDRNKDGDLEVTLGDQVPVELVYRDVTKQEAPVPEAEPAVDEALVFKLGQMRAKLAHLDKRISYLSKTHRTSVLHLVPKSK